MKIVECNSASTGKTKQVPQKNGPALIIAAHGSRAYEIANQPFHELASRLEQTGHFSAVTPAFLDGDPLLSTVLEGLSPTISKDVIVVPAMTAEGYYTKTVIPKRLTENANYPYFNVTIAPALGTHPSLVGIVARRIRLLLHQNRLDRSETTVVIVGHGTRRNPNSGRTTFDLATSVNQRVAVDVVPAFIDQDPEIGWVRSRISKPNVVVIPFLMGMGPHVTSDVPEAFELIGGPSALFPRHADIFDGRFICDQPVGVNSELKAIFVQMTESVSLDQSDFPPLLRVRA